MGFVSDRVTGIRISAKIEVYDITDSILIAYSGSSPSSPYSVLIPGNVLRNIRISADGYYSGDTTLLVYDVAKFTEVIQDFSLIPKRTGVIIEMKNIQFEANSSVLQDSSFSELEKVVNFLRDNPGVHIEVRGHTNGLCDEDYCNSLSLRRAKSVMEYFISEGIDAGRLTAKGYGKSVPLADNKTAEGRLRNQRVEFMITKTD
jgi:outer membrane protein OmpA-like peptidoglycan-associated protein